MCVIAVTDRTSFTDHKYRIGPRRNAIFMTSTACVRS